jgi:hypothetical protein
MTKLNLAVITLKQLAFQIKKLKITGDFKIYSLFFLGEKMTMSNKLIFTLIFWDLFHIEKGRAIPSGMIPSKPSLTVDPNKLLLGVGFG